MKYKRTLEQRELESINETIELFKTSQSSAGRAAKPEYTETITKTIETVQTARVDLPSNQGKSVDQDPYSPPDIQSLSNRQYVTFSGEYNLESQNTRS